MESLIAAQKKWERQNGLEKTISDVQSVIDLLTKARDEAATDAAEPAFTLAKLKAPLKDSFDRLNKDAKELHTSITNYGKLLDKRFKAVKVPESSSKPFENNAHLTNRAIGMHLLREGMFDVASSFVKEAMELDDTMPETSDARYFWRPEDIGDSMDVDETDHYQAEDDAMGREASQRNRQEARRREQIRQEQIAQDEVDDLQTKFTDMYAILHALRNERSLDSAIAWAKKNSEALEARGSNLEFDLCRLRFVELYTASNGRPGFENDGSTGPLRALHYARTTLSKLPPRYLNEVSALVGSLSFSQNLQTSPYYSLFHDQSRWEDVANSFIKEFCGLLGLSERSPLYTAVTAGGIALPVLEKLERVMGEVGGQWTSANELPVEIPLPPSYLFHSIFVCPVSKEQATDSNPPMMMPCGHVIAKESLDKISRGSKRFKCPYCPNESHPREAKKVFL